MDNPFHIEIYDKNLKQTGFLVDPIFCNWVASWDGQGYGQFMVDATNPYSAELQAEGARIVVNYRGEHLLSGPIRSYQGDLVKNTAVTYQMQDDRRILSNTLLWVKPNAPLAPTSLSDPAQAWVPDPSKLSSGTVAGQYGYFQWPDGMVNTDPVLTSVEAAMKYVVQKNVIERLGMPVVIAADQGRGGDPNGLLNSLRFAVLEDVMTGFINASGMQPTLRQLMGQNRITFDVQEPGEWRQVITSASGIIQSGTYSVSAPALTRPIIGGPGDTAARLLFGTGGTAPVNDAESRWGDVIEAVIDATDLDLNWDDSIDQDHQVPKYFQFAQPDKWAGVLAQLSNTFANNLYNNGEKTGLSVQLSETDQFHFGGPDGIHIGDRVRVERGGAIFDDYLTSCQIVLTVDNGLVVTPTIGSRNDDPDVELAKKVAAVAAALRRAIAHR